MPSIFLCHSSSDKQFVRELAARLTRSDIRVWLDEAELRIGDSLIDRIGAAIDAAEFVGVVLSKHSVESEWVQRELRAALTREFAAKRVLVLPIVLESVPIPLFLRDKLYADFSPGADHNASFVRLVATLQGSSVADAIRLTVQPLSSNELFQQDLSQTLKAAGFRRLEFPPAIHKRLLANATEACVFHSLGEIVAVYDLAPGLFRPGGKAAAIFGRRGIYAGGAEYKSSGKRVNIFTAYEDLRGEDFTSHDHEEWTTSRGTMYTHTLCVRGVYIVSAFLAPHDMVRAANLVAILAKRHRSLA